MDNNQEIGPSRPHALLVLNERGEHLMLLGKQLTERGQRMQQLAKHLMAMSKQNTTNVPTGSEGGIHVGFGSDAETALYELVINQQMENHHA